jgi:hypothetical protein
LGFSHESYPVFPPFNPAVLQMFLILFPLIWDIADNDAVKIDQEVVKFVQDLNNKCRNYWQECISFIISFLKNSFWLTANQIFPVNSTYYILRKT